MAGEKPALGELITQQPELQSTMGMLGKMIETDEQRQMLQWMLQQNEDTLVPFLRQAIESIPREAIPELVQQHMGHETPEARNEMFKDILQAYDTMKSVPLPEQPKKE